MVVDFCESNYSTLIASFLYFEVICSRCSEYDKKKQSVIADLLSGLIGNSLLFLSRDSS